MTFSFTAFAVAITLASYLVCIHAQLDYDNDNYRREGSFLAAARYPPVIRREFGRRATLCASGTYLSGTRCVTTCPNKTGPNSYLRTCVPCVPNSNSCTGTGWPTKCYSKYYNFQGSCLKNCPSGYAKWMKEQWCVSNCPAGQLLSGKTCVKTCPANYGPNSDLRVCTPCISGARTCDGTGSALSCNLGLSLSNGTCVKIKSASSVTIKSTSAVATKASSKSVMASPSSMHPPASTLPTTSATLPPASVSSALPNSSASAAPSSSNSSNTPFNVVTPSPVARPGPFLAGAASESLPRARTLPNRIWYDYDNSTVKDPLDVMQASGINLIRVQTRMTMPSVTGTLDDVNWFHREMYFQLDYGGIDMQAAFAAEAKARGMQVSLTINMGAVIPPDWQGFTYVQMLAAIAQETKRQLTPFLAAGAQPDIILLENEGTSGFLYTVTTPGGKSHDRGIADGPPPSQILQERCGQIPTGHIASYPQLAGYYKQEVLAAKEALVNAGFDPAKTRFGLHSHGQYMVWKNGLVYSTSPTLETKVGAGVGTNCSFVGVIPDAILNAKASDMLDIMGHSAYPVGITGAVSDADQWATFSRLNETIAAAVPIVARYGRHTSGPFAGQYIKQMLGVEFGTFYDYTPQGQYDQARGIVKAFSIMKATEWYLGVMWYEPTYTFSNWAGGKGSLYHKYVKAYTPLVLSQAAPANNLAVWASFAQS